MISFSMQSMRLWVSNRSSGFVSSVAFKTSEQVVLSDSKREASVSLELQ